MPSLTPGRGRSYTDGSANLTKEQQLFVDILMYVAIGLFAIAVLVNIYDGCVKLYQCCIKKKTNSTNTNTTLQEVEIT